MPKTVDDTPCNYLLFNKTLDEDNLTIGENILIEILKQYFLECGYKVSGNGFALFNYCVTACEKTKDKCFSNIVKDDIKQIMRK